MLSIVQNIFSKYKQYLSKYVSKKKKKIRWKENTKLMEGKNNIQRDKVNRD